MHAKLTASDSQGHQATTDLTVVIKAIPPRVTLNRDCAVVPVPVGCNNFPTQAGSQAKLFGSVTSRRYARPSTVFVDWGDGAGSSRQSATMRSTGRASAA